MNNNIYCRYAGTTNKKSQGFSITYAIVALVVVGVVLAGLTPVLTRKLPNLSTSSIIKNPKGWYESFNAPTEGARYCKTCFENHINCLDEVKKGKKKLEECKEPDNAIWTYPNKVEVKDKDRCFGNPACIPYVHPDDINPPKPTIEPKVIPFEQYCKSNGNCSPDPDSLPDKVCHDANYTITGKLKSKLKPCPCPNGKCKFKPQTGITKYEVYAIGGGGGSGSAIASDPAGKGNTYKESVTGSAKNPLPQGNNLNNDLKKVENNQSIDKTDVTYRDEHQKIQIANSSLYPKADFIDQSRTKTGNNPYKPSDFQKDKKSQHVNYPNILGDLDTNCATGIIYTIGEEDNNFHTYPTEDSNHKLAEASSKQIKRILGDRSYLIGKRSVHYYDRYYLYTRYLGAYAYNQNPVYLLMPEWVKVDNHDKRYPNGNNYDIDDGNELTNKEGIKDDIGCKNNDCNIAKFNPMNPAAKNGFAVNAITSKYSMTVGVVCSGHGAGGQDAIAYKVKGDAICDWMKPTACPFDILNANESDGKGLDFKYVGGDPYSPNYQQDTQHTCSEGCGKKSAPAKGASDIQEGKYCRYSDCNTYYEKDDSGQDKIGPNGKKICDHKYATYHNTYYDRVCYFEKYKDRYVECECKKKELEKNVCFTNDDVKNECANISIPTIIDPNIAADVNLLSRILTSSVLNDISLNFTFYLDNNPGSTSSQGNGESNGGGSNGGGSNGGGSNGGGSNGGGESSEVGGMATSGRGSGGYDYNAQVEATSQILTDEYTNLQEKHKGEGDLSLVVDLPTGGGDPECKMATTYSRSAYGGMYGKGVCAYTRKDIIRTNPIIQIEATPNNKNYTTEDKQKARAPKSVKGTSAEGDEGQNALDIAVCIDSTCVTAHGGIGGQGGKVGDICKNSSQNGATGATGTVTGNGAKFDISEKGKPDDLYNYGKTRKTQSESKEKNQLAANYYVTSNNKDDIINGTQHNPGRYNYRYIWYMPFVTKHLMFGLAGEGGEEVHSLVTLSEGQTLDVTPGKGAVKTIHTSGANGGNGGQSEVRSDDAKVKIVAHGGKGGLGSQKTDEYVLCHISDLQNQNPNLPCYYKNKDDNSFKSTHATEKDGKFVGILATQPKISTIVNSIKMSANLKDGTPGMGAMGFGTKSVSDVICENRHVTKWDEIGGDDRPTDDKVIESGGTLYNVCRGNSKIKYIIPNGSKYTAGTGAVIIIW